MVSGRAGYGIIKSAPRNVGKELGYYISVPFRIYFSDMIAFHITEDGGLVDIRNKKDIPEEEREELDEAIAEFDWEGYFDQTYGEGNSLQP